MKSDIVNQIYLYGKKERGLTLIASSISSLLLLLVIWLSITLVDTVFYFSSITRWGLLFINIPLLIYFLTRLLIIPFFDWKRFSEETNLSEIAKSIGYKKSEIRDHLVNLYQLSKYNRKSPLIEAAIEQIGNSITNHEFNKELQLKDYIPNIKIIISLIVSSIILFSFQHDNLINSTKRLLNPTNDYLKVPSFSFTVNPGDKKVLYNQPFDINVEYAGPEADQLNLIIYNKDLDPKIEYLEKKKDFYTGRIKEVTNSFEYQISAVPLLDFELDGHLLSEKYKVQVLIPPRIEDLKIKITPPAYSNNEAYNNNNNDGNITALAGSDISLQISSNKAIRESFLVINGKDSLALKTKGKIANTQLYAKLNASYKIHIVDTENLINQNPINYSISIIPDNPPYIDITEPGTDIDAQLDDLMKLKIDAADDYGLRNVFLKYRYVKYRSEEDSSWHSMKLNEFRPGSIKSEIYQILDFSDFYVGYNDVLEYYAVAVDNNSIAGFAQSSSPLYRINFPSVDELFEEFASKEEDQIDDLKDLTDQTENIRENLEELKRELNRSEQIDWEFKKELENTIEQQKDTQKKIDQIKKDLEEMINKLDQNDLMSPEMFEKYNKLQELFNEIAPPEILEAMKKLQQSLEKSNPNEVKRALENFKLNQEAFQANLERTLELFKQVQLEQQLDQLVQQADNLRKQQEKISTSMEDRPNPQQQETENLINEQTIQKEQFKSLQRNLENLIKKPQLSKFQETQQLLADSKEKIDQQKLTELMDELIQQMSDQQKEQAVNNSAKVQNSFSEMQQSFQQALQDIQQRNKQNVQKKMLSVAKKMLKLSHDQENVQQRTRNTSQINDDIFKRGREQAQLKENLQKLMSDIIDISKETFFMDPKITGSMANAYENMQKSMDDISERQTNQAATKQLRAMESLNMGINGMQNSMQQLAGSSSGTGIEQFMEQLQQMANAQGGLNGETLNFMEGEGNEGQLSLSAQAQRERMAAQQKAIQQAMEEMSEQMGNRSDILGRLGDMGETMDEVIQDMLNNKVSRKTINRQQQILSRMLDAQKSVREREFSKKRKAEQAKEYIAKDPGVIKNFEDVSQKEIQDALKKALSEGYHNDYQKLIEAYFKELAEKKRKKL